MADKMWDLLRYLKNPDGGMTPGDIAFHSENEKKQINDQLMAALENAERAVDIAVEENVGTVPPDTAHASQDAKLLVQSAGRVSRAKSAEDAEEIEEEEIEEKEADASAELSAEDEPVADRFDAETTAAAISDNFPETQETGEETLLKISVARVKPSQFHPGKIKGGNEITELSQSIKELGRALERFAESWHDDKKTAGSGVDKRSPETKDGSTGELLGDIAALIDKHRNRGISAQWRLKQMDQSALVAEITVDLLGGSSGSREDDE